MSNFASHVVIRLTDNRVLAPGGGTRRLLADAILQVSLGFPLLAFRISDTHIHLLVMGSAEGAAEVARRIEISLQRRLKPGLPFVPAWVQDVKGQSHLEGLFKYVLNQDRHHGSRVDPLHDGSNLPDLLGMRVAGRATAAVVREFLPRVRRAHLIEHLGIDALGEAVGPLDALRDATTSAACLASLTGRGARQVAARVAAIHAVSGEATQEQVGAALGIAVSSVRRLAAETPTPQLVRAIRQQLDARGRLMQARLEASAAGLYDPSPVAAPRGIAREPALAWGLPARATERAALDA